MDIKNIKVINVLIITILFSANLFAQKNAGTTSGQFLNLGIGARGIAMGNAYIANTCDASSVYWNPAGLGKIQNSSIMFMHGVWLEESCYEWLSYVKATKIGGFGFAIEYVNYGNIQGYDNYGTKTDVFKPSDKMFSLSYGIGIKNFRIGATGKYIDSTITKKATAHAVDLGAQVNLNKFIVLGLTAKNYFSSKLDYKGQGLSDPLPKNLEAGVAVSNILKTFLFEIDVKQNEEDKDNLKFGAGLEFKTKMTENLNCSFRTGYNTLAQDSGNLKGISIGFGFNINRLSIDYAYKPVQELGDTHLVSLEINL